MAKDYYRILGLEKGADEKEIKSAYRRLARKWHPDVNPNDPEAESKFKEISEAYHVLSDADRRKKYDRFGSGWEDGGFVWNNPNSQAQGQQVEGGFGDLFEQIFAGFNGRFGGFSTNSVPPEDVVRPLEVSLQEVDQGGKRTLTFQIEDACEQCQGTGQVQLLNGRPEACPQCRGRGLTPHVRRVTINIPPGTAEGQKLRVPGQGVKGSNGRSGDLYLQVTTLKDPVFSRQGDDLETETEIPLWTAVLGGEVRVPTLTGHGTIRVPEGTQGGSRFRLKGKGLPNRQGGRGDLYVKVKIVIPRNLSPDQRRLFEQLRDAEGAAR
ncbi:MAG: J domain-containing protein [Fimbriimonadaceae bacterium]|nr:J domain-containing protein [Fimbriimonadaceae bacterium]